MDVTCLTKALLPPQPPGDGLLTILAPLMHLMAKLEAGGAAQVWVGYDETCQCPHRTQSALTRPHPPSPTLTHLHSSLLTSTYSYPPSSAPLYSSTDTITCPNPLSSTNLSATLRQDSPALTCRAAPPSPCDAILVLGRGWHGNF